MLQAHKINNDIRHTHTHGAWGKKRKTQQQRGNKQQNY